MRIRTVGLFITFAALALAQLWPLPAHLASATLDHEDAVLNASIFGLVTRQLSSNPLHPFDVNMYYPFRHALAAVDHQISSVLLTSPVTWIFGPLVGHNVFVIGSFALAGLGACLLVEALTGSLAGGLLAGVIFAFSPFRMSHLMHSHVLAGCWLPFLLLSVHRAMADGSWRRILQSLGWFLLLALASWYLTVIAVVAVVVFVVFEWAAAAPAGRLIPRAAIAAVAALAVVLPLALPYLTLQEIFDPPVRPTWQVPPSIPDDPESITEQFAGGIASPHTLWDNSSPLESYVAPGATFWVPWPASLRDFGTPEATFFPGLVALLGAAVWFMTSGRMALGTPWLATAAATLVVGGLAIAAAASGRGDAWPMTLLRRTHAMLLLPAVLAVWAWLRLRISNLAVPGSPTAAVPLLGVAIVGWLLSLGPEIRTFEVSLGAGLYPSDLPPFNLLRSPARFGVLWVLGIASLAGFGLAWILPRIRQSRVRAIVTLTALLAAGAELLAAPVRLEPRHAVPESIYAALEAQPPGPVVEFPIHSNLWALLRGSMHQQPLINGSGFREPGAYGRLRVLDDLSPAMVEHLRTFFHPRYLIVDFGLYDPVARAAVQERIRENGDGLRHLSRDGDVELFEVRDFSRGSRIVRIYPSWLMAGRRGVFIEGVFDSPPRQDEQRSRVRLAERQKIHSWTGEVFRERNLLFLELPAGAERPAGAELPAAAELPAGAELPGGAALRATAELPAVATLPAPRNHRRRIRRRRDIGSGAIVGSLRCFHARRGHAGVDFGLQRASRRRAACNRVHRREGCCRHRGGRRPGSQHDSGQRQHPGRCEGLHDRRT